MEVNNKREQLLGYIDIVSQNVQDIKNSFNNIGNSYYQGDYLNIFNNAVSCIHNMYSLTSNIRVLSKEVRPEVLEELEEEPEEPEEESNTNIMVIVTLFLASMLSKYLDSFQQSSTISKRIEKILWTKKCDDSCSICMEKYSLNQKIYKTSCSHYFCIDCLDKWLVCKNNCPVCRADIDILL
jgi:hypothetical protein